ncbi:enoyl-CoA hydratase/isomerase family protein [Haloglomus salinum]|jgi:enoyl-CoA hydratase/carnithine racemase|uniref:enoyl-CoA hydratase/isomerase family protein n=1 Tax=Haloglomus salinum TaxID=2962673 RepID=UPI0020CA1899|nr:enoyl-CoA hydratase/isomerase family protein [Haloglomus salinum]
MTPDSDPTAADRAPDSNVLDVEYTHEHVARILLARPDSLNAYNEALLRDLVPTLESLDEALEVRAIILTGEGKGFCAGVDLDDMPLSADQDLAEYERGLGLFQDVVATLRGMGTPVVAAVNGYAMGAGCDTALACDFRIAGESATMAETFVDVGFVPGDGGAYLLPRIVGEAKAKELIMTGKHVSGEALVEWGLARECVPDGDLQETAVEFAAELAEGPPVAIAHSKELVNEAFDVDLETAHEHATRAQRICSQTEDHEEAVQAFAEDREPEFTGN